MPLFKNIGKTRNGDEIFIEKAFKREVLEKIWMIFVERWSVTCRPFFSGRVVLTAERKDKFKCWRSDVLLLFGKLCKIELPLASLGMMEYFSFSNFIYPCFVLLWTVFKGNYQGEEISIERENWSNSTSYGAFPQAIAALGISRLCCLLWRINICLGCKFWISSLCNIEHCMSQASKINIDEKQGQ